MRRLSLALLGLLLTAPAALAQKEFGFDNRKPSGQPYLKPEETVARFKVAPEFEVKLFAGEPQLVNPIAFTIDEKGRVWVVECFEYPSKAGKRAPRDRIVILEDTDGDGVCDKRTVFAEGKDFPVPEERKKAGLGAFDMASGIEVGHGGVFVGAPPYLWFIENKDDKPGKFEVLLKGFGSQDTHETLNTFQWGPDGWLYGLHGIFTNSAVKPAQLDGPEARINGGVWRYHPTKKTFEVFAEGTSNPWGMDWRNTDGQFILACCVIPHLYHIVPGGIYRRQAGASFNPHAYSYLNEICDHTFHKESGWAHAGLISLDAPHIPEKYRNSVIFGSIHGCSIKQNILKPNGSTYTASRSDDFLVSGDKNVRPINMRWGPNGDIYLIDWHDQNPCHQAAADSWDYERGRVYRIQLKGTKPKKAEDLGKKTTADLLKLVCDPNPYLYRTALRLLSEDLRRLDLLGQKGGEDPLRIDYNAPNAPIRFMSLLAAIGRYDIDQLDDAAVAAGIYNVANSPEAVTTMSDPLFIRLASQSRHASKNCIIALTIFATKGRSAPIRRELASAAIRLADKHDVTPLLHALMIRKEDAKDPVIPQLVWLAYEKVLAKKADATPADKELAWLAEQAPDNIFVRDQIVPKVMRRLVATGQPDDLKRCIKFVASTKDVNTREKALDGLAVALAGQTVNAPEGWVELQAELRKNADPRLVPLANKLAVSFRDPAAVKRAFDAAMNTGLTTDSRTEAVRQIALLKPTEGVKVLLVLVGHDAVPAVRAEAARALAAFDDPKVPAELLASWKDYSKELRADVVNTLAARKESARTLLAAMAAGKIDRAAVTDNTILRIQAFGDKDLNALIEKAWGRTRPTPAELTATIDKTRAALHDAPASFARGRAVFENTCGKCHKFEGKGADVGPPLDGAARDIEYILVNVIDPNRVIGAPYFLRIARLQDDTVQQGILADEDDKSITLKQENGVLRKIAKTDLEGPVKTVEKSLMPEGLGYNMTPQDFRDLVRYLMANPFLIDVSVNREKVAVGGPGRIVLSDTKGGPAVVEAEVTAPEDVKTALLVGSAADYEVRLDGKVIGTGKGTGKQVQPDQAGFELVLPKGTHKVAVVAKAGGGVVFARFTDPDRKLRYPDAGEKK
ncbi:MAG: Cytochrome c [Gemmataceae bacterium]|nr:Cytochrome c [Gemmataceae bacterium]